MSLSIRLDFMFGEISELARLVVTVANATGRPTVTEFNGGDLVANPGDTASVVCNRWQDWRDSQ